MAFQSSATNLVSGDTNGHQDIFVRNLYSPQSTDRVSVSSTSGQANGDSAQASISKGDARYVAFSSVASNLVPNDTNGVSDVFVRDMVAGTTTRISVTDAGAQANGLSGDPSLDQTGHLVAYDSDATNLVTGDTNRLDDVFRRDTSVGGLTDRWSVATDGSQAIGGASGSGQAAMVHNGQAVAFVSDAVNLAPGDGFLTQDVFLRFP